MRRPPLALNISIGCTAEHLNRRNEDSNLVLFSNLRYLRCLLFNLLRGRRVRRFISPSQSFSVAPRSEAGSEWHPTWVRFSILATRECARQPPARASPALLSHRPRTHSSSQCLMAIDISPLQGVFAGVHFPFGNTLIGLQFRRRSSYQPFLH